MDLELDLAQQMRIEMENESDLQLPQPPLQTPKNTLRESTLRQIVANAYKEKSEKEDFNLAEMLPPEELARPVFTNKFAVETLQILLKVNDAQSICQHIPYIVDAMELLLQKSRGVFTREQDKSKRRLSKAREKSNIE